SWTQDPSPSAPEYHFSPTGSPLSMSSRAMERLQEDVTCSICLDVLEDPVSIECSHNFCRGCLVAHWREVSAQGYQCPECRLGYLIFFSILLLIFCFFFLFIFCLRLIIF
uniref:RING-type domain-containing protein n=1 Tax=Gopherus agassizii TaxID=38772 RepID=A0A452GEZ0_9SAUR